MAMHKCRVLYHDTASGTYIYVTLYLRTAQGKSDTISDQEESRGQLVISILSNHHEVINEQLDIINALMKAVSIDLHC